MSTESTVNSLSTIFMVGKAVWNAYKIVSRPAAFSPLSKDEAYRPTRWSRYGDEAQMLFIAPNISEKQKKKTVTQTDPFQSYGETPLTTEEEITVGYFFDAFLKESHTGSVRVTDHPVQGGMNISDHAYNLPDSLTIEVFASDSMDSVKTNQFKTYGTKSVSVYETLRDLKERRVLVSVRTRLRYYENMIIENMTVTDDYKTAYSLKCTVSFRQIMIASVAKKYVALEKSQVRDQTNSGNQQSGASKNGSWINRA